MCGICGFNQSDQGILRAMLSKLEHRGPDHEGTYIGASMSMGMRRLAIIDLITGQQPVWNEDKSICVILNGEIYNYKQIRNSLLKKGHQLTTVSDSEILVHLYEDFGNEMFEHLEGMFAFCILDLTKNKCLLARDRFGEKPLYYYYKDQDFAFASEMQALLEYPRIQRKLNTQHLESLLRFGYSIHPNTLLHHVYILNPGHYLEFQNGRLTSNAYDPWSYDHVDPNMPEREAIHKLRTLLSQSVEKQMASDVPIGSFLSGGIDSSTISSLLSEHSATIIDTFNAKFEESAYDESAIAKKVANYIGSRHHEIFVPNAVFHETTFWEILTHTDQPFVDSSSIPSYFISKEIKKHLKVVLSGDGGDELFGGYDDFRWGDQIHSLRKLPSFVRNATSSCLKYIPDVLIPSVNWKRGAIKAFEIAGQPEDKCIQLLYEIFSDKEQSNILKFNLHGTDPLIYPEQFRNWSNLRKLMWFRTAIAMPGDMLLKVDRMSMLHSVEVRTPFLDKTLFDFAATLPDHYLRRGRHNKWLIRQVMKDRLPQDVFTHPKQGFNFPLHKFFNSEFIKFTNSVICKNHPLFNILQEAEVFRIIHSGLAQQTSTAQQSVYKSSHKVWLLLQLFAWVTHYNVDVE